MTIVTGQDNQIPPVQVIPGTETLVIQAQTQLLDELKGLLMLMRAAGVDSLKDDGEKVWDLNFWIAQIDANTPNK